MKKMYAILSFILISTICLYSFYGTQPRYEEGRLQPATEFSVDRAMVPLREIGKNPHYLGSQAHVEVRDFLIWELRKLGLEPHIQEGFSYNPLAKTLNKPTNIVAKIAGNEEGKALALLSHYDSAAIYSHGVSDDGVGVVTILESLRAFLASGKTPKNDIIILFTDAEEIGLDGAKLFVEEHPWAKNIGLVLNFEARGTSGPSTMILETNHGNAELIKNFKAANTPFPIVSSLMYSVYKLLPNDTDSTIFRELADIDSFFFAFIDDHFNYHTINDNLHHLNKNSLEHQGSYLLPLLYHFSDVDLNSLRSDKEYVYTNFPLIKILYYPFSWILPMLLVSIGGFITLLLYGLKKKKIEVKALSKGLLIFIACILLSGAVGFFGWKLLLYFYPHYQEIQQGFTYNGHLYIAVFISISISISFGLYHQFTDTTQKNSLVVAPLFVWILLNSILFFILKGAAFFIIPLFSGLLTFYLLLRQNQPNLVVLSILSFPSLYILTPLLQYFPVGLGLKMLMLSSIFTVLLFGLLLPVFLFYSAKRFLSFSFLLLSLSFLIVAHFQNSFSSKRPKPNSLVYYADADIEKAYWMTYDSILDDWTRMFLGDSPKLAQNIQAKRSYNKYGKGYTYAQPTEWKNIQGFEVRIEKDSLINNQREMIFTIIPSRDVHRIELYNSTDLNFYELAFNGKKASFSESSSTYRGTENSALINYHIIPGDSLEVSCTLPKNSPLQIEVLEYSYNLLDHPDFKIPNRPDYTIPKPFLITDAIAVKRTLTLTKITSQQKNE